MKFDVPDNHTGYDTAYGVFTVPITGKYSISAVTHTYVPSGEWEEKPNPLKKWWQFWKHSYTVSERYDCVNKYYGREIKAFSQGEQITLPIHVGNGWNVERL